MKERGSRPRTSRTTGTSGKPRRGGIAAAAAVVIALAAAGALWWRRASAAPWTGANVLVVTVDTLRTDALGAYGGRDVKTPAIDALAARGVVFDRAISTTPLTLPSHTTIFSGTYPLRHGVRDNGGYLVPKNLPLLAESFRDHGYETAAFVAAFVLDSRWGLNRGFQTYRDGFDTRKANIVSIGDIEKPAGEVIDSALAWLDGRDKSTPFFLWVHLFDPHAPYVPPPPFAEEFRDRPYYGEVAYADSQLARLFAKLPEQTAVILAGDHGESLGEHDEFGHGMFLYETTTHVPLIVAPPGALQGVPPAPPVGAKTVRRPETVSLADLTPTVVELAGFPPPAGMQGRSLVPLLTGRGDWRPQAAYSETYYPWFHFGWSPLIALQDEGWKVVESPDPELFDLERDPKEKANALTADRERYLVLRRRLGSLVEGWSRGALVAARPGSEDPEAARKLASLGYLSGREEPANAKGDVPPSPRSKLALYNRLTRARSVTRREGFPAAERDLRAVLAADPGITDGYIALADLMLRENRYEEAIPLLSEAVRRRPGDPSLAVTLAMAQTRAGRPADAEATARKVMDEGSADSRFPMLLAGIAETRGDRAGADRWIERAVTLDGSSAPLASAVAETKLDRGDLDGAEREANRALSLDPKVLGAHYVLAVVQEQRNRPQDAFAEYGHEVAVNAIDERSFTALARLAPGLDASAAELGMLEDSIERSPDQPIPYLYVARFLLSRGERLDRAVQAATLALDRASSRREEAFACFLLADLYGRLGDPVRAAEFARRARAAAPPA